jgi:hypothetical protein
VRKQEDFIHGVVAPSRPLLRRVPPFHFDCVRILQRLRGCIHARYYAFAHHASAARLRTSRRHLTWTWTYIRQNNTVDRASPPRDKKTQLGSKTHEEGRECARGLAQSPQHTPYRCCRGILVSDSPEACVLTRQRFRFCIFPNESRDNDPRTAMKGPLNVLSTAMFLLCGSLFKEKKERKVPRS